jgi:hypothetical protein
MAHEKGRNRDDSLSLEFITGILFWVENWQIMNIHVLNVALILNYGRLYLFPQRLLISLPAVTDLPWARDRVMPTRWFSVGTQEEEDYSQDLSAVLEDRPGKLLKLGEVLGRAALTINGMCEMVVEAKVSFISWWKMPLRLVGSSKPVISRLARRSKCW